MNQAQAREAHRDHFREAMSLHGKQMDAMLDRDEHIRQHLYLARAVARQDRSIRVIGRAFGFCVTLVWVFALAVLARVFL